MRLDCEMRERGDVTLVELRLENDATEPRRVRVANQLAGDVWFPRSNGVPAAGWDAGGYESVLDAGEIRALGYACPAAADSPPAVLAWSERAAVAAEQSPTRPSAVVREMGDPRPPRCALPGTPVALPEPVAAWLEGVESQIAEGALSEREEHQFSAVADRIAGLRRNLANRRLEDE